MEKKIRSAYGYDAASVRIDENGKASDMDPRTVMSQDGCNPVSRDLEMRHAYEGEFTGVPSVFPGAASAGLPGSYPGSIPPACFPGYGIFNGQ